MTIEDQLKIASTSTRNPLVATQLISTAGGGPGGPAVLSKREGELDRHKDRNGFTEPRAWPKAPLSSGLDRFLIETECRVERLDDIDTPD
jgi:hypothetical protein